MTCLAPETKNKQKNAQIFKILMYDFSQSTGKPSLFVNVKRG